MTRTKHALLAVAWIVLASHSLHAETWIDPGPDPIAPGHAFEARLLQRGDDGAPTPAISADRIQWLWRSGRRFVDLDASGGGATIRPEAPGLQLLAWRSADDRRFAKTMVVAGSLRPGNPLRWSELGHRLELVPQSDPARLDASTPFEVQVLFEREPLAGIAVEARSLDGGSTVAGRTDEIGVVTLRWPAPGRWVLHAPHAASGCSATLAVRVAR